MLGAALEEFLRGIAAKTVALRNEPETTDANVGKYSAEG
jgi:hypothetical protein